jgi:ABC-2 type transport system permease protein
MNYDVTDVVLATEDIPEDISMIIISSPDTDYSAEEIDKLDKYFKRGGDAIVSLTPQTSEELTNLSLLFEEWGIKYDKEIILDGNMSITFPTNVVPTVLSVENVTDKLNTKNYLAVIPGCMPIELTGTQTGSHTVKVLMTSSQYSYAKSLESITRGFDQEESDRVGPLNMCAISEYYTTDKNLNETRGDIFFCSAGLMSDSVLKQSNFLNKQFLYHVIKYISSYEDAVVIQDKNFESDTLTILAWQKRAVLWIVVLALPLAVLAFGVAVWARRKHL